MSKREKCNETLGVDDDANTRTIQVKFTEKLKSLEGEGSLASSKSVQELTEAYNFLLQNRPKEQALPSKIAAILSADVAEYSRLMAEDEEETLKFFYRCKKVFEDTVVRFNGRVFNTAGDAILSEFESVNSAAQCAMEIQKEMHRLNKSKAANRRILFRMGLNLGEAFMNGQDLLGDAVNIAARIQTAAAPGGVCLSGAVYDRLKDHSPGAIVFLGEKSFKNIPDRIRTYALTNMEGQFKFEESSQIRVAKNRAAGAETTNPALERARSAATAPKAQGERKNHVGIVLAGIAAVALIGFLMWSRRHDVVVPAVAPQPAPVAQPALPPAPLQAPPAEANVQPVPVPGTSFVLSAAALESQEKLADQGELQAQYRVGQHHREKQDFEVAFKFFRMAALRGHPESEFELGVLYFEGHGVQRDIEAAIYWLLNAAADGDRNATDFLSHHDSPKDYEHDINLQREIENGKTRPGSNLKQQQRLRLDQLKDNLRERKLLD